MPIKEFMIGEVTIESTIDGEGEPVILIPGNASEVSIINLISPSF